MPKGLPEIRRMHAWGTRALLLAGLCALARPASALPFEPGEHLTLSVSYMRMGIGNVDIDVSEQSQSGVAMWPLSMHARTSGFFNHIHSVDDWFTSEFDPVTLHSSTNVFQQHESNKDGVETTHIDGATAYIHKVTPTGQSDRTVPAQAGAYDVLSAIFFVRSQDLQNVREVHIPIFSGAKNWEMVARIDGRETIKTEAGQFDTYVVRCKTYFGGKFSSQKELTVWLSNDERRLPVKIEADFALGTMRAELKSYHHGVLASR